MEKFNHIALSAIEIHAFLPFLLSPDAEIVREAEMLYLGSAEGTRQLDILQLGQTKIGSPITDIITCGASDCCILIVNGKYVIHDPSLRNFISLTPNDSLSKFFEKTYIGQLEQSIQENVVRLHVYPGLGWDTENTDRLSALIHRIASIKDLHVLNPDDHFVWLSIAVKANYTDSNLHVLKGSV